jgi:hypothetical protein
MRPSGGIDMEKLPNYDRWKLDTPAYLAGDWPADAPEDRTECYWCKGRGCPYCCRCRERGYMCRECRDTQAEETARLRDDDDRRKAAGEAEWERENER